jgi:hypothetical protein
MDSKNDHILNSIGSSFSELFDTWIVLKSIEAFLDNTLSKFRRHELKVLKLDCDRFEMRET